MHLKLLRLECIAKRITALATTYLKSLSLPSLLLLEGVKDLLQSILQASFETSFISTPVQGSPSSLILTISPNLLYLIATASQQDLEITKLF